MLSEPLAVQVPPPAPTQVQVTASEAGKVSATVAPAASLGPAFEVGRASGRDRAAVAVVGPSVVVIARSAVAPNLTMSVAARSPGVGTVTPSVALSVAVLERVSVAAGEMGALAV